MFLYNIVNLLLRGINLYSMILVVYALLSWFPQAYHTKFGKFVSKLSEPFLAYFERFRFGMMSFSVIIALFFLQLLSYGIVAIYRLLL